MSTRLRVSLTSIALAAFLSQAFIHAQTRGQTPARPTPNVPRMPDGKPNLTGLWQALGTAYWDIRDHGAQPGPYYQLGAIGAIPAGQGIVEGGEIPYKPEASAKQKENFKNRLQLDPEVKCFMPGVRRGTYVDRKSVV